MCLNMFNNEWHIAFCYVLIVLVSELILINFVLQEGVDISDAIGVTKTGQPFAKKWPKRYKSITPIPERSQSVQQAFQWPAVALQNLDSLKLELAPGEKPLLLSGRTLSVSSNFSGICSQSRGARVLQSHGFGCSFEHVHLSVQQSMFCSLLFRMMRFIIYI